LIALWLKTDVQKVPPEPIWKDSRYQLSDIAAETV